MHGTGRKVHQRARLGRRRLAADAEVDFAFGDEKRLVPRMAVRRRTAAFRSLLQEDLVAFSRFARRKYGDMLTDDVQRRRVILRSDDEWFCGHGNYSYSTMSKLR